MTAMSINNNINMRFFDVIEYVKKLRNLGVPQEVAEVQAQEMEHALEAVAKITKQEFKSKDLATKHDLEIVKLELQKEIKNAEIKLMFLMASGFISTIGILLGVTAKGFHWI